MKEKYEWNIVPTIANNEMCSFYFEILRRGFLKKRVVYTGFYIFNRNLEVVISSIYDIGKPPISEKIEHIVKGAEYNSVEHMCMYYADRIFEQFKNEMEENCLRYI